jgi:uncharacterized membrane protein
VIAILLAVALGIWAAETGNELLLIPVVILGTLGLYLLSRRVKEVIVDERGYSIAGKASWLALRVFVALAVIIGAVLVILNREGSPLLFQVGLALLYSVCAMLVIYYIAHIYYNRKFGGKE